MVTQLVCWLWLIWAAKFLTAGKARSGFLIIRARNRRDSWAQPGVALDSG
jgi:hypothetical protein